MTTKMTIKTNNTPRDIIGWHDLTEKERSEFDYLEGERAEWASFVRYKGEVIDLDNTPAVGHVPADNPLAQWDGYRGDSFFSGVVVRYVNNCEQVICGSYFA